MSWLRALGFLLGMLGVAAPPAMARSLALDELVLFVPDTARPLADGGVEARIEAWVYEIEMRPGLSETFARYLDLDLDALSAPEHERFYARTQLFRVDSESSKDVRIVFSDGSERALPRTNHAGRSSARLHVPRDTVDAEGRVAFHVRLPRGNARAFPGHGLLVPEQGLSVVSDIDDTIKISQVLDRHELLLNTFTREFAAVPGMAARYAELAATPDTRFHYVSAGPIQLYPALAPFLEQSGFPPGSMHLRESTSIYNVIPSHGDSRLHKLAVIRRLLRDFPQRRFLLVGDSGEADPEIYAEIAREAPQRVAHIHIRDVTGETRDAARYRKTFDGVPASAWSVFCEPPALQP